MKLFVSTAALALAVAFAAPVMATDATTATTEPTVMMSADDCAAALAKCTGADKATCEKDLEAKGCKAPEAAK